MSKKLSKLDNKSLDRLARRVLGRMIALMRGNWDMGQFKAKYPRKYRAWYNIVTEGRLRY